MAVCHPVLLPEILVEAVHWQEVDVGQKHVGRVDLPHGHVPQQVDRVELPLFVDDVITYVAAAHQHLGALSVAQKLLGLGVRQVQGQTDGAFPVLTDGLQHLEPAEQCVTSQKQITILLAYTN